MPHGRPSPFRAVAWLFALALGVRLALWLAALARPEVFLEPDSHDYLRLAGTLAQGSFGESGRPEIFRVPGYPVFLAGLAVVSASPGWACLVQCLLDSLTCLLVWRLVRDRFGERTARLALVFQALSIVSITYCCRVLSETLFTFIMVLLATVVAEIWRWQRGRPVLNGLAAGCLVAAASCVRAIGGPLVVLLLAYWIARRRWREAAATGIAAVALLAPWHLRNAARTGFSGFSTVSSVNLYRYNAAMLLAEQNGLAFAEQLARIDARLSALGSQREVAEFANREGWRIIRDEPLRYAVLHLRTIPRNLLPAAGDLLRTLGAPLGGGGTLGVLQSEGIASAVRHYFGGDWRWALLAAPCAAWLAATFLLAVLGGWRLLRAHWNCAALWLVAFAAVYFVVAPGGAAHPRFRVPIMPLVSVAAAVGMAALRRGPGAAEPVCRNPSGTGNA